MLRNKIKALKDILADSSIGRAARDISYELKTYAKLKKNNLDSYTDNELLNEIDDYLLKKTYPDWFVDRERSGIFDINKKHRRDPTINLGESVAKNAIMFGGGLAGGVGLGKYLATEDQDNVNLDSAIYAMIGDKEGTPLFYVGKNRSKK